MIFFLCLNMVFIVIGLERQGCVLSFQHPPLENRIVGGQNAKIEEVPYQLSMFQSDKLICGASIIDKNWILTAAHCVLDMEAKVLSVRAGSEDVRGGHIYNVSKIIKHKDFKTKHYNNDIALLQIHGVFQYGNKVKAVKLPDSEPQTSLSVTVSGWGKTNAEKDPKILQKTIVAIVDREVCKKNYKALPNTPSITSDMICAGDTANGGKDACVNDSGGPLVADNKLYGIISWGKGCGNAKYPGVYTNVHKYLSWIDNNKKK